MVKAFEMKGIEKNLRRRDVVAPEEVERIRKKNKLNPKNEKKRRLEIARIGSELYCLGENDVIFILDDRNDIFDAEQLFRKRRAQMLSY